MLLPPGASFICAVNANHYFLKQSAFMKKIIQALEECPAKPLILRRTVYFTFDLTVSSNPMQDAFEHGRMLHQNDDSEQMKRIKELLKRIEEMLKENDLQPS